jgi:chromosome segregation ATPase
MSASDRFDSLHRLDDAHAPKERPSRALELLAEETSLAIAASRAAGTAVGDEASESQLETTPQHFETRSLAKVTEPSLGNPDAALAQALLDVQSEQIAAHLQAQLDELARQKTELTARLEELRLTEEETKEWVSHRLAEVADSQETARIERDDATARLAAAEAAEDYLHRIRAQNQSELKEREFAVEERTRELAAKEAKLVEWENRLQSSEQALEEHAARQSAEYREKLQRLRSNEQKAIQQIAAQHTQIERLLANQTRRRTTLEERERALAAWIKRLEAKTPKAAAPKTAAPERPAPAKRESTAEAKKFYQAAEGLRREAASLLRETLRNRLALDELWTGLVDHASRETLLDAIDDLHRQLKLEYAAEEKRLRKRQREVDAILNAANED